MEEKPFTLEDLLTLERELASTDLERYKVSNAIVAGQIDLKKICDLYKKLRGVIAIALGLSIVPPFVKAALRALMALLDQLCG